MFVRCFNLNKHFEHVMINYILIGFINLDKHFKHVMLIYMLLALLMWTCFEQYKTF
jgi:hypothetical protein